MSTRIILLKFSRRVNAVFENVDDMSHSDVSVNDGIEPISA